MRCSYAYLYLCISNPTLLMISESREGRIYIRPVGRGIIFEGDDDVYLDEWVQSVIGGDCCYADIRVTVEILDGPWPQGQEPPCQ